MKTKVINLYGTSDVDRSVGAAYIFAKLKFAGINCELVRDYMREIIWSGEQSDLVNQGDIFYEQFYRQEILRDKVGYIITDSPLLLSIHRNQNQYLKLTGFYEEVEEIYDSFENVNFFVNQLKDSEKNKEADQIRNLLYDRGYIYWEIEGNEDGYDSIVEDILKGI